jgi:SAM-dependent methyltransferase|tara:strand:+ start:324 stop:1151 length:828 start_codon:yes stop_codon:yes gene_type:complete
MNKILEVFRAQGLLGFLATIVNTTTSRFFGFRFTKSISIKQNRIARRIFSKRSVEKSNDGYFYLNPMPTEDELTEYYQSLYWNTRTGKYYGASTRDLMHFNMLKTYIPSEITNGKVFLNFGAGHGGVSNLLWLAGMDIINIEPSGIPKFYEQRWNTYKMISSVQDSSVDIIYGSHSLEHVQNIDKLKSEVKRVLKPNASLFWEVPNADHPTCGAQTGNIDIPHTYYFSKDFFDNWFSKTLLNKSYEQCERFGVIERWFDFEKNPGPVIRALGKID